MVLYEWFIGTSLCVATIMTIVACIQCSIQKYGPLSTSDNNATNTNQLNYNVVQSVSRNHLIFIFCSPNAVGRRTQSPLVHVSPVQEFMPQLGEYKSFLHMIGWDG